MALYSDQQAIDSTSPFGKAMMQMACVFGELERGMSIAERIAGHSVSRIGVPRRIAVPSFDDHVAEPDALEPEAQAPGGCAAFLIERIATPLLEAWLGAENFDAAGQQHRSLSAMTAAATARNNGQKSGPA